MGTKTNGSLHFVSQCSPSMRSCLHRFVSVAKSKTVDECDAEKPHACTACELTEDFSGKAAPGAITLFRVSSSLGFCLDNKLIRGVGWS